MQPVATIETEFPWLAKALDYNRQGSLADIIAGETESHSFSCPREAEVIDLELSHGPEDIFAAIDDLQKTGTVDGVYLINKRGDYIYDYFVIDEIIQWAAPDINFEIYKQFEEVGFVIAEFRKKGYEDSPYQLFIYRLSMPTIM